jgi:hypothetical protein
MKPATNEISWLLALLDEAFDKKSWHGPTLRGATRRVTAEEAGWRPGPKRRSIADIVVHCAYWKYAVRRRLLGQKRGSFVLKGSNWFRLPETLFETDWHEYLTLLDDQHRLLREAVASFPPAKLGGYSTRPNSPFNTSALIRGIAAHDLYHAGQIQLLKRLVP